MWRKFSNTLQPEDKAEMIEVEEMELQSSDIDERGRQRETTKDLYRRIIIKQSGIHINLHGIRYCFDHKFYRRLIWIILLCISMGIFIYVLCATITIYLTYPSYTVSIEKYSKRLEYPSISICNSNDIRFSTMNGTKLDLAIKHNNFNFTSIGLTMEDYMNTVLNASHRIEDMLYSCQFSRKHLCKPSDFTAFHHMHGIKCFTLNTVGRSRLELTDVNRVGLTLTMVINVEHHDYYNIDSTDHAGIRLIIHGVDENPSQMQGHLISPGIFTQVNIKKHQIKNLPPPYTECGTTKMTLGMKYFKKYTVQHCYLELLTDHVVNLCGCRDNFMPGNAMLCSSFRSLSCMWIEWGTFAKNHQQQSSCPMPCVTDTYSFTSSFAMFPSNNVADQMAASLNRSNGSAGSDVSGQERRQFIRENFLKLAISYNGYSYQLTKQIPFYNTVNLLGTIGGLMALFIGASLLTYVELIDFILTTFFAKCGRK